jgi:hypothetical protein
MSERGAFRGGRGGARGGDRGGRGGGRGGAAGAAGQTERPKKENILDLSKYMDKRITVKFSGGREGRRDIYGIEEGVKADIGSHWDAQGLRPTHEPCPRRGQRSSDRRRRQHPVSQAWSYSRTRYSPRRHFTRRWK